MKNRCRLMLLLIALLGFGCSQKSADPEGERDHVTNVAANVEVEVAVVQQVAIRQIISAGGTLAALPDRDVKISALAPGRINQLLALEGSSVHAGQVVARLDDSILKDQLN